MIEILNDPIMDLIFFDNTVRQYLIALGILLGTVILIKIFKTYILGKLKKIAQKTETMLDDIIVESLDRISLKFYIIVALYVTTFFLVIPPVLCNLIYAVMIMAIVYYLVRVVFIWVDFIIKGMEKDKDADHQSIEVVGKIVRVMLWAIAGIFVLQFLGYDVTTLVAGLGIGGIAIAFALQNVLQDIFAAFTIYYDKPFKKGDYIVVGDKSGDVITTGLKSTRIKTLLGDELVISNKVLLEEKIHNYKKMKERRITFQFGVEYGTPIAKMKKVESMVNNVFNKTPGTRLHLVRFITFGEYGLLYEVIYYVKSGAYTSYREAQELINYGIMEGLEKENIKLAIPTQIVYLKK